LRVVDLAQDRLRVAVEKLARICSSCPMNAAFKQPDPELRLKVGHVLAQRWLRDKQRFRCGRDVLEFYHLDEVSKVPDVHDLLRGVLGSESERADSEAQFTHRSMQRSAHSTNLAGREKRRRASLRSVSRLCHAPKETLEDALNVRCWPPNQVTEEDCERLGDLGSTFRFRFAARYVENAR